MVEIGNEAAEEMYEATNGLQRDGGDLRSSIES